MNHPLQPAILFDFGGVLMDWNAHYLYDSLLDSPVAVDQFLEEIGFSAWNLDMDGGRPFAESVADLSRQFPQHAALLHAYDERWEETLRGPIQPSLEILRALKRRGYPLYGLTNWSEEKFEITRRKYPIFDVFENIVVSGTVKLTKPDPRIFALTLQTIGRPAQECLLIDDSQKNILAASAMGFQTIHFKSPEQLQAELIQMELL